MILRWNAFRGGADQAALSEARALTEQLRATRDLAAQQVRLEVQQAYESLEVADASLEHGAEAHRSRRRRVPHHRPQARPRADQPGGFHRRAPGLHRRPAQPHPRANRVPRAASPSSSSRSATRIAWTRSAPDEARHAVSLHRGFAARRLWSARPPPRLRDKALRRPCMRCRWRASALAEQRARRGRAGAARRSPARLSRSAA